MALRLGVRHRWQTKRGGPRQAAHRRLDHARYECHDFPDPDRDNFGQDVGLFDYDFRWHLGDRSRLSPMAVRLLR